MQTIIEVRIEAHISWLEDLGRKHSHLKDRISGIITKINQIKPAVRRPVTKPRQMKEIEAQIELCEIGKELQKAKDPQHVRIAQVMADIMAPTF